MNPGQPLKTLQIEQLPINVYNSNVDMGKAAAWDARVILQEAIAARGEANIILATGNSQLTFLHALRDLEGIDWSCVNVFHMDEYLGMSDQHSASFPRYIREKLTDHVHPRAFYPMRGDAPDGSDGAPVEECGGR